MSVLYVKTKNLHWHVSDPHFRDCHLLADDQGGQILAATDPIPERACKLGGGTTLRSIDETAGLQRIADDNKSPTSAHDLSTEMESDNTQLLAHLHASHALCDDHSDVATASLLKNWIVEAEGRVRFPFEASCRGNAGAASCG